MRITFDNIIFAIQRSGGISVVWQELLSRAIHDERLRPLFLEYPSNNAIHQGFALPDEYTRHLTPRLLERYRLVGMPKQEAPYIFHSSYFRITTDPLAKNITTVHDLTYHFFRSGLPKRVHLWEEERALRHSQGVICVSENTKSDLLRLYPWLREEDVRVIYNGVSDHFVPLSDNERRQEYLLFVGNRAAYKNFQLAVETARLTDMPILIVGGQLSPEEDAWVRSRLREGQFTIMSSVPNKELNALYNNAYALLYPSAYEGFGIPVVEAQKAGCPVLTMNASSIPEVAGDAALFITPNEKHPAEALAEHVRNLRNTAMREELIRKGYDNATRFSWDKTYSQTINFYTDIYNR